ncbi:hypothetical protein ACCO45_005854 [Purpureocillium lilacinum]|uniref:Uncharacterized protein n=1 Tax=Purpureocillium lilacinum TaxID=33203 RepID=A0ACC4DXT8_PURLI
MFVSASKPTDQPSSGLDLNIACFTWIDRTMNPTAQAFDASAIMPGEGDTGWLAAALVPTCATAYTFPQLAARGANSVLYGNWSFASDVGLCLLSVRLAQLTPASADVLLPDLNPGAMQRGPTHVEGLNHTQGTIAGRQVRPKFPAINARQ